MKMTATSDPLTNLIILEVDDEKISAFGADLGTPFGVVDRNYSGVV